MKWTVFASLLILATPALAQQPQQTAIQQLMAVDAQIKANLAEQLDKANAQIADLTKQLAEAKKPKPEMKGETPAK